MGGLAVIPHRVRFERFHVRCCVGFGAAALCQVKTLYLHDNI